MTASGFEGGPKYRPRASNGFIEFLATCFVKAPFRNTVTYDLVRACVTADDKSQALPHLRQCLVFHIRCSLGDARLVPRSCGTIAKLVHFHAAEDEGRALVFEGCFRARGPRRKYFRRGRSHPNDGVGLRRGGGPKYRPRASNKLDRASPSTTTLFRRRSHAPLSNVHSFRASSGTTTLIRRRNNENSERDVLRHDVISFGVEPL